MRFGTILFSEQVVHMKELRGAGNTNLGSITYLEVVAHMRIKKYGAHELS